MVFVDTRYGDSWSVTRWPKELGVPQRGDKLMVDDDRHHLPFEWEITDYEFYTVPKDDTYCLYLDARPWRLKTRLAWRLKKLVYNWFGVERDRWLEPYASSPAYPTDSP